MSTLDWNSVWEGFKRYYKWPLYILIGFVLVALFYHKALKPFLNWCGFENDTPSVVVDKRFFVPADPSIFWIDESKMGGWVELSSEGTPIKIPHGLRIYLGDPEDESAVMEYQEYGGTWHKYQSTGSRLELSNRKTLVVRTDKPTRAWLRYYYKKENRAYVKSRYGI